MASKRKHGRAWIEQIFKAKAAKKKSLVRREVDSVKKNATEAELKAAVKKRRFKLLRIGGQYVIVCNTKAIVLV